MLKLYIVLIVCLNLFTLQFLSSKIIEHKTRTNELIQQINTLEEVVNSFQVRPTDQFSFNIDRVIPIKSPNKNLKLKYYRN
jgi:hypothetical protein